MKPISLRVKKYNLLRELVFNVGSLTEIGALCVAYLLGADKWEMGLSLLVVCVLVNNALSRGWLWLIKRDESQEGGD